MERPYEADSFGGEHAELQFFQANWGNVFPTRGVLSVQRDLLLSVIVSTDIIEKDSVFYLPFLGAFKRGRGTPDDEGEEETGVCAAEKFFLRL